jgi:DNA modification methylase
VTDRPTKSHEYVFLLTKQPKYFFDQEAVREKADWARWGDQTTPKHADSNNGAWMQPKSKEELEAKAAAGRNIRTVWTVATQPYPEAHFATYPEELVRRCVLAGCPTRVCLTCGKPSERQVDVSYEKSPVHGAGSVVGRHYETGANNFDGAGMPRLNKVTETLGWSDCGHNNWRPGRVLDPFVGSGTTCKVARDHGRHSIGIDLSEDYLRLAARRLQQQSLLTEPAA